MTTTVSKVWHESIISVEKVELLLILSFQISRQTGPSSSPMLIQLHRTTSFRVRIKAIALCPVPYVFSRNRFKASTNPGVSPDSLRSSAFKRP